MSRVIKTFLLAATVAASAAPGMASGQQVTVGTATTGNCYPFICASGDGRTRYQQVYSSSEFSSNVFINALTFYRTIYGDGVFDGNTYSISLSTTSAPVNGLSSNPSSNVGADNTLFWTGILSGPVPSSFTLTGLLPFSYNPALGNLLMDVVIGSTFHGTYNTFLDATADNGVSSRAYGTDASVYTDVTSLVTTFDISQGTVGPVPEPASLTLLGTGILGLVGIGRRKFAGFRQRSA